MLANPLNRLVGNNVLFQHGSGPTCFSPKKEQLARLLFFMTSLHESFLLILSIIHQEGLALLQLRDYI